MRKKLVALLACCLALLVLCGFAPAKGWWLDVSTSELGDIRIYLNYSYYGDYFTESNGKPVLMYNSTINGYVLNSSGDRYYAVTIYPYGETWQYRLYSQSSTYNRALTINSYNPDSSSIGIMGVDAPEFNMYYYLLLFFGGALLLGVWRCARK